MRRIGPISSLLFSVRPETILPMASCRVRLHPPTSAGPSALLGNFQIQPSSHHLCDGRYTVLLAVLGFIKNDGAARIADKQPRTAGLGRESAVVVGSSLLVTLDRHAVNLLLTSNVVDFTTAKQHPIVNLCSQVLYMALVFRQGAQIPSSLSSDAARCCSVDRLSRSEFVRNGW